MPIRSHIRSNSLDHPLELIRFVLNHRLVIITGKGGTGKTTCTAWLAAYAASQGNSTIAAEVDPRAPLAALFGCSNSYTPVSVGSKLSVMLLDGKHALEEYIRLVVPGGVFIESVLSSSLFERFVTAAPGLKELMTVGKLYELLELRDVSESSEIIVLDAPSTGQAVNLLRMPFSAQESFAGGIVAREAKNVARMLRDSKLTCAVLVTIPEPLSLKETVACAQALQELDIKIALVVLNRFTYSPFTVSEVKDLVRRATREHIIEDPEFVAELALAEARRAAQSRKAVKFLRRSIDSPILAVEVHGELYGTALVRALCESLRTPNESPLISLYAFA